MNPIYVHFWTQDSHSSLIPNLGTILTKPMLASLFAVP